MYKCLCTVGQISWDYISADTLLQVLSASLNPNNEVKAVCVMCDRAC